MLMLMSHVSLLTLLTRENNAKLYKLCSVRDSNFFANRVNNIWNSLASDVPFMLSSANCTT